MWPGLLSRGVSKDTLRGKPGRQAGPQLAARCLVWVVWVVLGVRLTKIKKENNAHIMNINSLLFQRRKAKNFRSIGFAMKEGTDIVLPFLHDGKEDEENEEKEKKTKVDKRKGKRRGKGRKIKERVKE